MVSPLLGRFLVSFNLQSAICGLQSAVWVCSLQSAVCSLQSAVWSLRSAVCCLRYAVCKCHTPGCYSELGYATIPFRFFLIPGFRFFPPSINLPWLDIIPITHIVVVKLTRHYSDNPASCPEVLVDYSYRFPILFRFSHHGLVPDSYPNPTTWRHISGLCDLHYVSQSLQSMWPSSVFCWRFIFRTLRPPFRLRTE